MEPVGSPRTIQDFIRLAADSLQGEGWQVLRHEQDATSPWHLVARKGSRWRVVQITLPASSPGERQEARLRLGDSVRLPSSLGSMEQWLGHVRPDGKATFGPYVLSAQRWADRTGTDDPLVGLGMTR